MCTVKSKIRRDDEVVVISGRDAGNRGKVMQVDADARTVTVSKVNRVKRHTRPSQNANGGIIEKEMPLALSNVQFWCANCKSGVRLGAKLLEDDRKVRVCRKCGEVLDS